MYLPIDSVEIYNLLIRYAYNRVISIVSTFRFKTAKDAQSVINVEYREYEYRYVKTFKEWGG